MNALPLQVLMLIFAGWVNRHQQDVIEYLQEEDRALREQLDGKRLRFTDQQRRPKTAVDIHDLILTMSRENPRWGNTRVRGALYNLGHDIGRNTIKRILLDNGFDPIRKRGMSWKTFLKVHWGATAATDFFSVEVITRFGLVRYFVLFVIDLKTRRVDIAGILARPNGEWTGQIANATAQWKVRTVLQNRQRRVQLAAHVSRRRGSGEETGGLGTLLQLRPATRSKRR